MAFTNHRTRVFQVFDGAGVVISEEYDFKGNLERSRRDLLPDYKGDVDWRQNPTPNDGTFTSSMTFDALNRPTAVAAPDNSVYRPTYNKANLLDRVEVNLRSAATATPFVTNVDYNAKGQRTLIHYANGAETTYEYDDQTFRLIHLKTTRAPGQNGQFSQIFKNAATVQDLRYTYDPAGNITRIEDAALLTIFHNGEQVMPVCDYTYDALYRLIEASGREHIGQTAFAPPNGAFRDYPFTGSSAHPNDLQALRNYTERYEYDAVGNFERLIHQAGPNGGWTRDYAYDEPSLIESAKQSNRLSSATIGQTTENYAHDAHGNMTTMPHLTLLQWDFKDQLRASSRQAINNDTPETAFYVYDASGLRVRKVTERQNGGRKSERVYVGSFEIYREYNGNGAVVTLARETLHVMDDKQRIALVETKTVDNSNSVNAPLSAQRFQIGNHLGSASLELDKDSGLIAYEEYHPYGATGYQVMNGAAEVSLRRYRYTGKERDEESGFGYAGMRYYAPWFGRWITADPAGSVDGPNLYTYVRNNPIKLVDPDGRQTTTANQEMIAKVAVGAFRAIGEAIGSFNEFFEQMNELEENKPEILRVLNADPRYLSDAEKRKTMDQLNNSWAGRLFAHSVFPDLEDRGPHMESLPLADDEFEIGGRDRKPNFTDPSHRNDFAPSTPSPGHPIGHSGNDIFAKKGKPVLSPVTGRIVRIIGKGDEPGTEIGGKQVIVQRGKYFYYMGHLDTVEDFQVGDIVFGGTQLGTVGNTGNAKATEPHIHFEIGEGSPANEINPFPYLMEHIGLITKAKNWVQDIATKPEARESLLRSVKSFVQTIQAARSIPIHPAP